MSDKFETGFLRDDEGALVVTGAGPEESGWLSGFVRDDTGALVVVGPEGEPIGQPGPEGPEGPQGPAGAAIPMHSIDAMNVLTGSINPNAELTINHGLNTLPSWALSIGLGPGGKVSFDVIVESFNAETVTLKNLTGGELPFAVLLIAS